MMRIKTTFSRTTPESAEHGDFSETGWIDERGEEMESVMEAVEWLQRNGAVHASSSQFHAGIWYSTDFSISDYSTGEEEEQAFHLYGFTKEQELELYNRLIGID